MPAALSRGSYVSAQAIRLGVWNVGHPTTRPSWGQGAADGVPDPTAPASHWQAEWHLQRRCALSPRQLLAAYAAACVLALGIAGGMHQFGAAYVLPFALFEVLALGVALLVFARHAADREFIGLSDDTLRVERYRAGHVESVEFDPRWVRIEPQRHDLSLIRVSGQGRSIDVGQHVQPAWRRQLASEFRWALRQVGSRSSQ
ncbi:MAG: hypothetical protein RJB60_2362 [Pseudomonadota bacterium]|jgi:uncharacterized membrane protein